LKYSTRSSYIFNGFLGLHIIYDLSYKLNISLMNKPRPAFHQKAENLCEDRHAQRVCGGLDNRLYSIVLGLLLIDESLHPWSICPSSF